MTIYWLLFALPACMALLYPVSAPRNQHGAGQEFAFVIFIGFYSLLGMLRYEVGGDWFSYDLMYEDIRTGSLGYALERTEPLFGLLNWISSRLGAGVYLVNGVSCFVLGYGTVAASRRLREPWLGILIAVPYLLIVVGLGYVRQGAAIGLLLIAIASLGNSRPIRTVLYLVLATGFHVMAVLAFPIFAWALTRHNKMLAVLGAFVGAVIFIYVLVPRLADFEAGYIDAEYDSSGALLRILMGFVPALLVLFRWRYFQANYQLRSVWFLIALANVAAAVGLIISPSSTAVDRAALFFAVIQIAAFAEFRNLTGISDRMVLFTRIVLIGVAALVQTVWLIMATHAIYWVPYQSILQFL